MSKGTAVKIKAEKIERLKTVKRGLAVIEDRDITDVSMMDAVLDKGLTFFEEKIRSYKHKHFAHETSQVSNV